MESNKKVLAILSLEESKELENLNALISTYRSMLKNRYFNKSQKELFQKEIDALGFELNERMTGLFKKHKISLANKAIASISYETGELYVTT